MLSKIKQISARICPFGGINFVIHALRKAGIHSLIDSTLGKRVKQSTYLYSDVIMSWIYANLCGAERLEDSMQLRPHFSDIPESNFPSSDRIAYIFKKLATPNDITESIQAKKKKKKGKFKKEILHNHNHNATLVNLLLETSKKLKLISTSGKHVLDYDNTLIETEKWDSKITYLGFRGYSPAAAFIGKIPVYVEGRDGNTNPTYRMDDTIKDCISSLRKAGINIDRVRSDAAAYSNKVIEYLDGEKIEFFIRATNSEAIYGDAIPVSQWQEVVIAGKREAITSISYKMERGKKEFRVVLTMCLDWDLKNEHWLTGLDHPLRCIITNNLEMTDKEVVEFYNKRGDMERNFSALKGDFNWSRLPFSFLNENTVFMLISALANVVYEYVLRKFSKVNGMIKYGVRLKRFIFSVISYSAWWTKLGELVICSEKPFYELIEEGPPDCSDGP